MITKEKYVPYAILQFKGKEAGFLSNFAPAKIRMGGRIYPSVEAAFQAAKTTDPKLRVQFETASPAQAKQLGKQLELRPDWEEIKVDVMRAALKQKFRLNNSHGNRLMETEDADLVDGNYWNDTFWGFSLQKGYGENMLGRLLMERRAELLRERGKVAAHDSALPLELNVPDLDVGPNLTDSQCDN